MKLIIKNLNSKSLFEIQKFISHWKSYTCGIFNSHRKLFFNQCICMISPFEPLFTTATYWLLIIISKTPAFYTKKNIFSAKLFSIIRFSKPKLDYGKSLGNRWKLNAFRLNTINRFGKEVLTTLVYRIFV